jgi:hypothetical protein
MDQFEYLIKIELRKIGGKLTTSLELAIELVFLEIDWIPFLLVGHSSVHHGVLETFR